jgi:hypothetical protein
MFVQLVWDDLPGGNEEYIALRGVTKEEFEEVFFDDRIEAVPSTSTGWMGRMTKAGLTSTGKYVRIVWEEEEGEPQIIIPVTVFFPDDPLE